MLPRLLSLLLLTGLTLLGAADLPDAVFALVRHKVRWDGTAIRITRQ